MFYLSMIFYYLIVHPLISFITYLPKNSSSKVLFYYRSFRQQCDNAFFRECFPVRFEICEKVEGSLYLAGS